MCSDTIIKIKLFLKGLSSPYAVYVKDEEELEIFLERANTERFIRIAHNYLIATDTVDRISFNSVEKQETSGV